VAESEQKRGIARGKKKNEKSEKDKGSRLHSFFFSTLFSSSPLPRLRQINSFCFSFSSSLMLYIKCFFAVRNSSTEKGKRAGVKTSPESRRRGRRRRRSLLSAAASAAAAAVASSTALPRSPLLRRAPAPSASSPGSCRTKRRGARRRHRFRRRRLSFYFASAAPRRPMRGRRAGRSWCFRRRACCYHLYRFFRLFLERRVSSKSLREKWERRKKERKKKEKIKRTYPCRRRASRRASPLRPPRPSPSRPPAGPDPRTRQ